MNDSLKSLLKKYPSLMFDVEKSKILCKWTNHELPLNEKLVNEYVNGKKYQHLLTSTCNKVNFDDYLDFLIPCTNPHRKNQLFCKLTYKFLNNQVDHVEKHILGKKFQRALKHWNHCKETNQKYKPPGYQAKKKIKNEENDVESDNIADGEDVDEDESVVVEDDKNELDDDEDGDDIPEEFEHDIVDEGSSGIEDFEEMSIDNDDDDDDDDDDNNKNKKEIIENDSQNGNNSNNKNGIHKRKFNKKISSNRKNEPKRKKHNGLNNNNNNKMTTE